MYITHRDFDISFFRRLFGKKTSNATSYSPSVKQLSITQQQRIEVLKALADETRLALVQKLCREGGVVAGCDLSSCASIHKLSQPAMSHHFGKLVDAGVIVESKQGTQKLYALNEPLIEAAGIHISSLVK